jgi:hypothetical protein
MCEQLEPPQVREPIEWSLPIGITGPTRVPLQVVLRSPRGA